MLLSLISMVVVLGTATLALLLLYVRAVTQLKHFNSIKDVETYKVECEQACRTALSKAEGLRREAENVTKDLAASRLKVRQYQDLLGKFQTAAQLRQRIHDDKAKIQQLSVVLGKLEHASQLDDYLRSQETLIAAKKEELENYSAVIGQARIVSEVAAQVTYHQNLLAQLKADIEAVEEVGELQEFGFYRPRYEFDAPDEYKRQLETVRNRQKAMLKEKHACVCQTEWTVDGDKREGQKMVNQQIKLMLRAFNGECDAAVAKVRYNNVVALQNRIRRSFDSINKLGVTKRVHLVPEFCELKYEELHLAYEYQEKREEQREEQRRIREQMKEEEKVAKEIEEARLDAERDELLKSKALEKAREELAARTGQQTAKLEQLVSKLETELQDALDRKAKAIARAQLTKSGHVYILSNIGTFGDGVYKIGLTRRLEPLERVRELGGAAVPFPFDVHAMIYSEDAPALENRLHRHFEARRVNLVNLRREFFRVTLDEIHAAVAENFGHISFVTVPQAEQYRRTLAMIRETKKSATPLQIA